MLGELLNQEDLNGDKSWVYFAELKQGRGRKALKMVTKSVWGNGALRRGGTHVEGGRGGLITPLGGTRRDTDPQAPGIGRWQRLLGMQVNEHVRA